MAEEFKVRSVGFEDKPLYEREKEHQKEYEEKVANTTENVTETLVEDTTTSDTTENTTDTVDSVEKDIDDNIVLSHIKNKYGKDVTSLEDLLKEQKAQEDLPDDVSTFYKYKKETGRGIEDFVKLTRDLDAVNPDSLITEYLKETNPELDEEDIAFELEKFKFDEDLDDEKDIKNAKLLKKKELAKAKDYFNSLKEQYKTPLESRDGFIPQEELNEYEAYKNSKVNSITEQEEQIKRSKFFAEKTEELFSDKFEGFGFTLDENNKVVYKPADAIEIKNQQSNLQNFIGKFLNEEGYLANAEAFHKAIAVANDPDKFAKFFYEKGKADMATGIDKESKNIDMLRSGTPSTPDTGTKVRAVNDDSGNRIKFKKR